MVWVVCSNNRTERKLHFLENLKNTETVELALWTPFNIFWINSLRGNEQTLVNLILNTSEITLLKTLQIYIVPFWLLQSRLYFTVTDSYVH